MRKSKTEKKIYALKKKNGKQTSVDISSIPKKEGARANLFFFFCHHMLSFLQP